MSFASDLRKTQGLEQALKSGLQALKDVDKSRVTVASTRNLRGSADIDLALQQKHPNSSRWDYVIGYKQDGDEVAYFIEVHPASGTSSITSIVAKADWLMNLLRTSPLGTRKRVLVWVSSGSTCFTQRDPKVRILASRGVRVAGQHLRIS